MPYTREVYDQLLALIDHATVGSVGYATTVYSLYQDVENIVREEALIYFAGDASVEEAAARMQQRASTLLAEQD